MRIQARRVITAALAMLGCYVPLSYGQVNVTTYHNDNSRTGQNLQETILTPSNVNSTQFGKLFSVATDGYVYAQPLYLAGVNIGGGTYNVTYVATEHDSLYAIDADSGNVFWHISLLPIGGTTVSPTDLSKCQDIVPEVGITGTPVIDNTTGTIYLVAKSKVGGKIVQYLHAIDVVTSAEKFGGPVLIQGSVPGTTADSVNGVINFDPILHNQRTALLLQNGHVVIAWASHCDVVPWHGWVMSYSASTLAQEAIYNNTTAPVANGDQNGCGGVWMANGGMTADANGNMYFASGNGGWNGTSDLSDSIIKIGPPSSGTFPVLDFFTPYNQQTMADKDADLGSGAALLLPTLANGKQLLTLMGKLGTIYLLDTSNLGQSCITTSTPCTTSDPQVVQEIVGATAGIWGSPAFWNNNLYWTGANDPVTAFSFNAGNSGLISTAPTSQSAHIFPYSAPTPAISANGTSNAILWALDNSNYHQTCASGTNCQGLYAYDATNLSTMLYNSTQAANYRDVPGSSVKFTTPTIAGGKVIVGSQSNMSVYGLLPPTPVAGTPAFSPASGTYTSAQSITLSDATGGAQIYYTLDGSTPTTSSTVYSAAIPISASTTIKALAVAAGYSNSVIAVGNFTITAPPAAATVTYSPAPGTYTTSQTVTMSDATPGVLIYYTKDGTTPTNKSNHYTAPVTVTATTKFNSLAMEYGYITSPVATAQYSIQAVQSQAATPTLSPAPGNYTGNQSVTMSDATPNALIYYTKDGSTPTNKSNHYTGPVTITGTTKFNAIAVLANYTNSPVATGLYSLSNASTAAAAPALSPTPGSFTATQTVTITAATANSTIYYTLDGSTPTPASPQYTGPLTVSATTTVSAIAIVTGLATSPVTSGTYTISAPATAAPTFSPAAGTFTSTQTVTLADATANATLYYTLDGSAPTTSSSKYTASLTISATTQINALAVSAGMANSAVTSASYTISAAPAAATPTFSPAAGNYTSTQSVTLSTTTAGARIYYTKDGSTPTTSSARYSSPLSISSKVRINAVAVASGSSNSAIASALYNVTVPSN